MATINPRGRQLAQVSRAATQPARITQAAIPQTSDPALNAWIGAMHEWRHVREGGGNPFEKVLTGRDLVAMGIATSTQITNPSTPARREAPGVVVHDGNGGTRVVGYDEFSLNLAGTSVLRDLRRRIDDPTRFDELHARTRALLLEELAPIDGKIRGEIRRVEEIATSAKESLAQEVTTIRASIARTSAGVRQVRAASASENRATAAIVTTVTARLDDFDGGGATVESVMSAIADRTDGLEAKYTLKVTAGGAMAGYGLAATDNGSGNATSAFIIQADKFAIVSSSYAGGLTTSPDVTKIPFGIDGTGIYMTSAVRIDGSLLVSGTVTADHLNAATGTFSGSLSAASGTFSGTISGAANINITGQGKFDGATSNGVALTSIDANSSRNALIGVYATSGTTVGAAAIRGMTDTRTGVLGWATGAAGVGGSFQADGTGGQAVSGIATGSASIGGTFQGTLYSARLYGPLTIDNSTLVTNLNADLLDGNHASAFLAAGATAAAAAQISNSGHTYTFSGGSATGSATATFSGTNKPGANSSNIWLAFVIDGATYYTAAWPA